MKLANVALVFGMITWSDVAAADIDTQTEGWHTWQIDAPEQAAGMCCVTRQKGSRLGTICDLDRRGVHYESSWDCGSGPGHAQVYAQIDEGRPVRVWVLSSECQVATKTEITDHGTVSNRDNIQWFRRVIEDPRADRDVRESALFGLVQAGSDESFDYIDQLLSQQ